MHLAKEVLLFMNHAVARLVEALRYKPEVRSIYCRYGDLTFSLTSSFLPHCGPGVDCASNGNEYQEYFLVVMTAGA